MLFKTKMPGNSYIGPIPELSEKELRVKKQLQIHLKKISDEIGERNIWKYDALEKAAAYIYSHFKNINTQTDFQEYRSEQKTVKNIETTMVGSKKPKDILVIGAHYDSVWCSPGANDNGTGIAALLELARILFDKKLKMTLRFVAFVNEEPPFFGTWHMGSRLYAHRCRQRKEKIVGMISLETIGYFSQSRGSQDYPFLLGKYYPDRGNFIAFVSNLRSKKFLEKCILAFRDHAKIPSEGVAAPSWIEGIGLSDHRSFWQENYPAIMITDTAPFRYPYYHTEEDTSDKIKYTQFTHTVCGLSKLIEKIGEWELA